MAEPFTIYKLTILYMLSKAGFPLSNTQISNFFLEQEYTDYFRVQEVIGGSGRCQFNPCRVHAQQHTVLSDFCGKRNTWIFQR